MLLLLNALLLFRALPNIYAAPTAAPVNATSGEQYVAWQSQSNIRGTWDILVNCAVTMSLCIWTALHLNLPISENYMSKRWEIRLWHNYIFRQFRWVFMGLIAPELLVYMAWTQRKHVDEMNRQVKSAQQEYLINHDRDGIHLVKWSTAHSWYLLMGGFYFETRDSTTESFIPEDPQLIITPAALQFMAATKPPLLPEIDEEVILDCSKADRVTKLLALIQAFYIVAQSISRVAKRLPISQLEINTIGHVLCAFAIFFFWFDKPKDVQMRTPITAPWARPLCAYMWISERGHDEILDLFPILRPSPHRCCKSWNEGCRKEGIDKSLAFGGEKNLSEVNSGGTAEATSKSCKHGLPPIRPRIKYDDKNTEANFWSSWQWINPRVNPKPYSNLVMPVLWKNFRELDWYPLDDSALLRFNLALQYFRFWSQRAHAYYRTDTEAINFCETDQTTVNGYDLPPYLNAKLFTNYAKNWISQDDSTMEQAKSFAVIALLTACYGGLHTLAWLAHFPTIIECYAWRISALVIGISGFVFAVERAYTCWTVPLHWKIKLRRYNGDKHAAEMNEDRKLYDRLLEGLQSLSALFEDAFGELPAETHILGRKGSEQLARFCAILLLCVLVLARLYIVFEAFLSLRSMPPAMYETPTWTNWVPHL